MQAIKEKYSEFIKIIGNSQNLSIEEAQKKLFL